MIGLWSIRLIAFALLFSAMLTCLAVDIRYPNSTSQLLTEASWTEYFQLGLLLSATLALMLTQRQAPRTRRPVVWIAATVSISLAIREADFWLDTYVYDGAWQHLVLLALVALAGGLIRHRHWVKPACQWYLHQPAAVLLFAALAILFFSRIFGAAELWLEVMAESYLRSVKNVAEESVESLGLVMFFLAMLELAIIGRSTKTNATADREDYP